MERDIEFIFEVTVEMKLWIWGEKNIFINNINLYNYYKIDGDKLTDTNTKIHTFYRSYDSIKKMILILKILY